jgi:hypothetical protein
VILQRPPISQHRVRRSADVGRELQPPPAVLVHSDQGKLLPRDRNHGAANYERQIPDKAEPTSRTARNR